MDAFQMVMGALGLVVGLGIVALILNLGGVRNWFGRR